MTSNIFQESSPSTLIKFENISDKLASNLARRVYESIYPLKKGAKLDKSNLYKQRNKKDQEKKVSLTPIPLKYYRDPKKNVNRQSPTQFKLRNQSLNSPSKVKISHKKVCSQQYTEGSADSPSLPMKGVKGIQSFHLKSVQCEALSQFESYCNSFIKTPIKKLDREKKKIVKSNEEMNWVTKTIQNYGIYEENVRKELIKYSKDSREEFDQERAKIVGLIKSGVFDPNKNIIKMKTRLKRKNEDL